MSTPPPWAQMHLFDLPPSPISPPTPAVTPAPTIVVTTPPAITSTPTTHTRPHQPATLQLCVLGSGSSGNCSVVRHGDAFMLIDAGFGPRATAKRLDDAGLVMDDIQALCLTHLDRDHFNPNWLATLVRQRIGVFVHRRHVYDLYRVDSTKQLHRAGLLNIVDDQHFEPLAGLTAAPFGLPHDRQGTLGFRLEADGGCIGYATDLGSVPDALIDHFAGTDILAIESNYDPQMQTDSPRPPMLKRRIMNGAGHLSNEQAFEAVQRIVDNCPLGGPAHIVLLHRSRQCNCPDLVRRLFERDARLASRLTLTEQTQPTAWLAIAGAAGDGDGGIN